MSGAYYNEIDPYAAQWLRHLMAFDYIAPGDVDERSIEDVRPEELRGYKQCHFFAGIGVWSYALRRAGWRDDRAIWTGSCPCQPFSAAGKRGGTADERHLWPAWFHLISFAKPRGVPVLGEQVASKDGLAWLDLVQADLEGQDYTVRALDLCAAGVGAPHIRQRLYFVADSGGTRAGRDAGAASSAEASSGSARRADGEQRGDTPVTSGATRRLVGDAELHGFDTSQSGEVGRSQSARTRSRVQQFEGSNTPTRGMEHATSEQMGLSRCTRQPRTAGYWSDCDWLPCIDGKARPVEPGTFPLAHGVAARVGRLRAYGNAIVAPLAEEVIRAYMSETR